MTVRLYPEGVGGAVVVVDDDDGATDCGRASVTVGEFFVEGGKDSLS